MAVTWKKPDGSSISTGNADYPINEGIGTQTTTLTIAASVNIADKVFTCEVTPVGAVMGSAVVKSDVYGEY